MTTRFLFKKSSKQIISIILLLSLGATSYSQFKKGMNIETNLHFGKVIKHTPELLFDGKGITSGFDINFTWQTYGKKEWHQFQNYPKVGIGAMVFNLGDRDTLGYAYGIDYNITLPLFKSEKFRIDCLLASGFAMLDRPFNRMSNPNNNAIGSRLNVIAHMKFMSYYQFNPKWKLTFGGSFTHFSNGAAQLPNFGVNIGSGMVGLTFTPTPLNSSDYIKHDASKASDRKLGLRLEYSIGYRESQTFGGPRYPIKAYSLGGVYYLNKINRLLFGSDYEFNRAIYVFGNNVFQFNSDREAFWGASRITIFVGDEFVFGNFGVTLQAGYYLGNFSYQVPQPIYFKMIARYYVPVLKKPFTRAFAGISLKSHFSVAEYFALNIGLEF
jgi:lipid A 3-O-deacylase PagL